MNWNKALDTIHSINLIVSNPDVRKRQPCLAGTELRVLDIVAASLFHGQTLDDIAAAYDISLEAVHATLAYYYGHKEEIDSAIRTEIDRARALKGKRLGSQPPFLFG